MQAGKTGLVSVATNGTVASGFQPDLSADGSTVAFLSEAKNLVAGFVNNGAISNLYVRNLSAGTTTLATASDANTGGGNNGGLYDHSSYALSGDGSVVAFSTDSSNLFAGDLNGTDYRAEDIFAATTATGQGSISGQVFGDTNGDGVLNNGEAGLAGWTVFLDANGNGTLDPGEVSVVTDASGLYKFSGLSAGTYTVATSGVVNPFTYVGQAGVLDDGSGLFNMRARTYNPATGQFLTNDPLGPNGGDPNIRRYAHNNPVTSIDPSGLGYFVGTDAFGIGDGSPAGFASGDNLHLGHTEYITDDGQIYQFALDDYVYRAPFNGDPVTAPSEWAVPSGPLSPGTQLIPAPNQTPDKKHQVIILDPTHYNDEMVVEVWKHDLHHSFYGLLPFDFGGMFYFDNCHSFAQRVHGDVENLINGDPNDLVGPAGFGTGHAIPPNQSLSYAIDFENDPKIADIPVEDVRLTESLDPGLDWSTFALGPVGFGANGISVPAGLQAYQTSVTTQNQDGTPLRVDVAASLDLQTGLVTWTFHSIDPATGTLPVSPFAGFLPVDDASHRGEGFVNYVIRARAGAATGTAINAQATIVFDVNAPLATNVFTNAIDGGPPTSSVMPLPSVIHTTSFPVTWSGKDDPAGAGIASYDVYVSVDGGPFTRFLAGTAATSTTFTGAFGHSYAFYSVGTDQVGNVQPTPLANQAATRLTAAPLVVVESFQLPLIKVTVGSGKRAKTKTVRVLRFQFSGPVNGAGSLADYQVLAGTTTRVHKKLVTTFKKPVRVASAVYNATTFTVTLYPVNAWNLLQPEQLTITAARFTDAYGRQFDGNHDGQPGGNFVAVFGKAGVQYARVGALAGKASPASISANAFDALMRKGHLDTSSRLGRPARQIAR